MLARYVLATRQIWPQIEDSCKPALEAPMKGTILDFLKLTTEKPELSNDLIQLAAKYDFKFSDEVTDSELDAVAGGIMKNKHDTAKNSINNIR